MRPSRLLTIFVAFVCLAVVGCGDDGGTTLQPDAAIDAPPPPPDAPPALTGIGKPCVIAMGGADCPQTVTDGCLGPFVMGGTMGICTKICVMAGTFSTNAQSQPQNINPDPTTQGAVCVANYSGTPGSSACEVIFNRQPTGALMANMNYTFQAACAVKPGTGNACPAGLRFDAMTMWCIP